MRNLKKILALALVFAMALTFTAGAADFTDKADIDVKYVDDVNMLVELGVIGGYPDGSFGPKKNITRAEFAKMAYTLKYGSDSNGDLFAAQKSAFTDVEGNANVAWAKGYINYCANQKIVSGVGNNKFNPQGNITVAEATKMVLVILGCDPAKEGFTGANWAANVVSKAIDLGVFKGWSGDPTALATRELVAKLMKNAVFSPVYTYSAITGTGSQLNALGDDYNQTLGEKTMNLRTITGIVAANENYVLRHAGSQDADDLTRYSAVITKETDDEDLTFVYYEDKDADGKWTGKKLELPMGLSDDYLGNEISVFFRADEANDGTFVNIELIGEPMVTANTVIYDVPATDVGIYPNGEDEGTTPITPYIGFKVDGVEKQIKAPKEYKVAKGDDVYDVAEAAGVYTEFAKLAHVSTQGAGTVAFDVAPADKDDVFFTDMGEALMSTYRFVSVDGGKSYAYIFKMVDDGTLSTVSNYSEAKGVITLTNGGLKYIGEDVVISGDVAVDDTVITFTKDGILNVVKVDTMTGAVKDINEDGSVVINDKTYFLWGKAKTTASSEFYGAQSLADYFSTKTSAMKEGSKYYVYGNLIVDVEPAEEEAVIEEYAVILRSRYDKTEEAAYVTVAHVDGTEKTYRVGALCIENDDDEYAEENDKATDFENNAFFGMVVKYAIMADGSIDLSENDLGKEAGYQAADSKYENEKLFYLSNRSAAEIQGTATAAEGVLEINGENLYAYSEASKLFVLYGDPQYMDNGDVDTTKAPKPVKAAVINFMEAPEKTVAVIDNAMVYNKKAKSVQTVSYVLNSTDSLTKGILVAAITVGKERGKIGATNTEALAYVAAATQKYDAASKKYYREMSIIDENGLVTTKTAADLTYDDGKEFKLGTKLGKVTDEYGAGNYIAYKLDAEGNIAVMDSRTDEITAITGSNAINVAPGSDDEMYLINILAVRNGRIFYTNVDAGKVSTDTNSLFLAEDGYEVIAIDAENKEYVGTTISQLSTNVIKEAGQGNAVVIVNDEDEVIRIYSFVEAVALKDVTPAAPEEEAPFKVTVERKEIDGWDMDSYLFGGVGAPTYADETFKFAGTLKYVEGFEKFDPTNEEKQEGHYIHLKLDFGYADKDAAKDAGFAIAYTTYAGDKAYDFNALEADATFEIVLRVDGMEDGKFVATINGTEYTFDFSALKLQ